MKYLFWWASFPCIGLNVVEFCNIFLVVFGVGLFSREGDVLQWDFRACDYAWWMFEGLNIIFGFGILVQCCSDEFLGGFLGFDGGDTVPLALGPSGSHDFDADDNGIPEDELDHDQNDIELREMRNE